MLEKAAPPIVIALLKTTLFLRSPASLFGKAGILLALSATGARFSGRATALTRAAGATQAHALRLALASLDDAPGGLRRFEYRIEQGRTTAKALVDAGIALRLFSEPGPGVRRPPVLTCSALTGAGVDDVWQRVGAHREHPACQAPGLQPGQLYGYRVYGPHAPEAGHRFNCGVRPR